MPWPPHLVDAGVVFLAFCFRSAEVVVNAQPSDFSTNFQNEVAGLSDETMFKILECWAPCANGFTGNEIIPSTDCKYYHECWYGQVWSRKGCGAPLVFNAEMDYCDFATNVDCFNDEVECPDTVTKAPSVTPLPTLRPTPNPTYGQETTVELPVEDIIINVPGPIPSPAIEIPVSVPDAPIVGPSPPAGTSQSVPTSFVGDGNAMAHIQSKKNLIEKHVLVSYNNGRTGLQYPSKSYTYDTFIKSLQIMAVDGFGADFKFNLWEGDGANYHYGLVNLALFLANCMIESIETDSCDELNWQHVSDRYAISNSCGQEGRSYQDETCRSDSVSFKYSCEVNPEMELTASSASSESRAAPPFECISKSQDEFSGYWDASSGSLFSSAPFSNSIGRTDAEGCCWWGRGALATRGICNIGKINYYLGKRGAQLGRDTLYPDIDWCEYPEATCASGYEPELRWIISLFEWSDRIQSYSYRGWNYEAKLKEFVDNGMVADDPFVDSVSRVLSRGCHSPDCSNVDVRLLDKRRSHFYVIIGSVWDMATLMNPPDLTRQPTQRPPGHTVPNPYLPQPPSFQQPNPAIISAPGGGGDPGQYVPASNPQQTNPVTVPSPGNSPSQQITTPPVPKPTGYQNFNPSPAEPSSMNGDSPSQPLPPIQNQDEDTPMPSQDAELINLEDNGADSRTGTSYFGAHPVLVHTAAAAVVLLLLFV